MRRHGIRSLLPLRCYVSSNFQELNLRSYRRPPDHHLLVFTVELVFQSHIACLFRPLLSLRADTKYAYSYR